MTSPVKLGIIGGTVIGCQEQNIPKTTADWEVKRQRVLVVLLLVLAHIVTAHCQSFTLSKRIVLQMAAPKNNMSIIRAVFGQFQSQQPVWIQLWQRLDTTAKRANAYQLNWQVRIMPHWGNGTGETVVIAPQSYVELTEAEVVGVLNEGIPGPLLQQYSQQANVLVSEDEYGGHTRNLSIGSHLEFDDLLLPYYIPVHLCERTDCEDIKSHLETTTQYSTPTVTTGKGIGDGLLEDSTIIGLLIWLGLLSLFMLILAILFCAFCYMFDVHLHCHECDRQRHERHHRRCTRATQSPSHWSEYFTNYQRPALFGTVSDSARRGPRQVYTTRIDSPSKPNHSSSESNSMSSGQHDTVVRRQSRAAADNVDYRTFIRVDSNLCDNEDFTEDCEYPKNYRVSQFVNAC